MLLHCFFMSISTILLKYVQPYYKIIQIIFSYNLIICLILGSLSLCSKSNILKISLNNIGYHFLRSIFGFIGFLLFFYAISNMNIIEARAIISIDPIITSILALFFFRESININKIVASIITFIGSITLLHPSNIEVSAASVSAFSAAIFFGVFNNITKKITSGKVIEQMFYLSFFSLIYSFIPSLYCWNNAIWLTHIFLIVVIASTFVLSSFCAFNAFKNTSLPPMSMTASNFH